MKAYNPGDYNQCKLKSPSDKNLLLHKYLFTLYIWSEVARIMGNPLSKLKDQKQTEFFVECSQG